MNTPTPEQLTRWQSALSALWIWDKSSVSVINQSHMSDLNEMADHAQTARIDFGCSGCTSEGLNRLARIYKEHLIQP